MYSTDKVNGNTVFRGSGREKQVVIDQKGIDRLDCGEMICDEFNVSGNPLKTLSGGPKKAHWVNAQKCQLADLGCGYMVVDGTFDVSENPQLTSLRGCPKRCSSLVANLCGLTELECPRLVVNVFNVADNPRLTSLKNGPPKVEHYNASNCGLTDLGGAPASLQVIDVHGNARLTSLRGGPTTVARSYYASNCGLTELDSGLENVNVLSVTWNPRLTSLRGGPLKARKLYANGCDLTEVGLRGDVALLDVRWNKRLKSLLGCPKGDTVQVSDWTGVLGAVGRYKEAAVVVLPPKLDGETDEEHSTRAEFDGLLTTTQVKLTSVFRTKLHLMGIYKETARL